jgi:isopropylmalate/homocitrate/citramalate synthase
MALEPRKRATIPRPDPDIVQRTLADLATIRRRPWFEPDAWSLSPLNFVDGKTPSGPIPKAVTLVDISGRVVEQMPGIGLTRSEKVELARGLADCGIPQMQAVQFIRVPEMSAHVREIVQSGVPIQVVVLTPAKPDIEAAALVGSPIVEITTNGRPSLWSAYQGLNITSPEQLLTSADERIRYAKSLGLIVRADINGVGFSEPAYIRRFVQVATDAGADYIHLADGNAGLGPHACAYLVRLVKDVAPDAKVGLHLHNDFGLAMSCALAALEAGAEVFDVTVNGLGEKAGQLDLGTFAVVLKAFYGVDPGIRFERLRSLSRLLADLSRVPVPPHYPITGDNAFASAVANVQREELYVDPYIHVPLAPEFVGHTRHFPLGRHSRDLGLLVKAESLGVVVYEDQITDLLGDLDRWFEVHKRQISDEELRDFLIRRGCEEAPPLKKPA